MKNTPFIFGAALLLAAAINHTPLQAAQSKAKTKSVTSRSWVLLKASTDKKRYAPGDKINVRLAATNTAKRGAYLRFTSGQRFDFSVARAGSNESVYTWSATRMFIQSLGSLWLKSGQSQNYNAEIGGEMGELKPGRYRLLARLTNTPRPIEAAPVEFEIADSRLSFSARTAKTTYKFGEPVQITATATNTTGAALTVHFDSGLDCDLQVTDAAGKPIWNYGANLRFIRALGDVTWQKGETKTYTITWRNEVLPGSDGNATLKPGRYTLQAVLQSTPQLRAAPIVINIAP